MVSVAATCGGAADGWDVLGLVAATPCGACSRLRGGGLCRIPLGTGAQRDLLEDQGEKERRCQQRDQVRVQGRERLGERGGDDMPEAGR